MNDKFRAALIAFVQSLFPVLILFGVVEFTDTQIASIMLAISNGLTLAMLLWKNGQEAPTTPEA